MFITVKNEKKHKAALAYYYCYREDHDFYLFTKHQLDDAKVRAEKNPEDIQRITDEHYMALDIADFNERVKVSEDHHRYGYRMWVIGFALGVAATKIAIGISVLLWMYFK